MIQLLVDTLVSTLTTIGRLALLLIPIMILIELARHFKLIEKMTDRIKGALKLLTLPPEAAFPLLVGMFFGIVLGAALIIDYAREGILNRRDLILIGIFLSISHSVIEDTFIFAVFGANPLTLVLTRLLLAIIITRIAAIFLDRYYAGREEAPADIKGQTPR